MKSQTNQKNHRYVNFPLVHVKSLFVFVPFGSFPFWLRSVASLYSQVWGVTKVLPYFRCLCLVTVWPLWLWWLYVRACEKTYTPRSFRLQEHFSHSQSFTFHWTELRIKFKTFQKYETIDKKYTFKTKQLRELRGVSKEFIEIAQQGDTLLEMTYNYLISALRSRLIVFNDFSNVFKSSIWLSVRSNGGVKCSKFSTNLSSSSTPRTNWVSVLNSDWIDCFGTAADSPPREISFAAIFFAEIIAMK